MKVHGPQRMDLGVTTLKGQPHGGTDVILSPHSLKVALPCSYFLQVCVCIFFFLNMEFLSSSCILIIVASELRAKRRWVVANSLEEKNKKNPLMQLMAFIKGQVLSQIKNLPS